MGLAVGLRPLGGLTLGLSAAHLIRRHGSRTIALWPQILSTTCLLLLARAPHIAWVFVAMIVMNVFDALTDIAMDNVNSTPGLAAGSGLTVATWSRRLGFTLRWALVCLPAGAALILMATPAFQPVTAAPPDRHIHRGDDSLRLIDQRPVRRWPRRAAAPRRHVPG